MNAPSRTQALNSPIRKRRHKQCKGGKFKPAGQSSLKSNTVTQGTGVNTDETMEECLSRVDTMIKKVLPNYDEDDAPNAQGNTSIGENSETEAQS